MPRALRTTPTPERAAVVIMCTSPTAGKYKCLVGLRSRFQSTILPKPRTLSDERVTPAGTPRNPDLSPLGAAAFFPSAQINLQRPICS